jgi:hypothetical protein
MRKFSAQTAGIALFTAGLLLTVAACGILASHARLFGQKRDTAVMIGTQLPELKASVALLAANVEAEQMFAEQAQAAREEQAAVYVLPEGSPSPRTVKVMQALTQSLDITLSKLWFDSALKDHGSYKTLKAHMTLRGSFQQISRLLAVTNFGGDMMVRDVLPVAAQDAFLRQVEAVAPLSLKTAEDFLYLDLMQYADEPDMHEQKMLDNVPTAVLSDIRSALLDAGLADVRRAFSDIAEKLFSSALWPMPLLTIDSINRNGEVWTIDFTVFSR